jgi:hypothetical protein
MSKRACIAASPPNKRPRLDCILDIFGDDTAAVDAFPPVLNHLATSTTRKMGKIHQILFNGDLLRLERDLHYLHHATRSLLSMANRAENVTLHVGTADIEDLTCH